MNSAGGFLLLLRLHGRLLVRRGSTGPGGRAARRGLGTFGRLALFGLLALFVSLSLGSLVGHLVSGPAGRRVLSPLLTQASIWATLVILLAAVPLVLGAFTLTSDLQLLLQTPLSPRLVLAEKFLSLYGGLILPLLIGGFLVLLGAGRALQLGPAYPIAAILVLLLLPAAPLAIGMLLVVAALRWVPPARARAVAAILGAAFGGGTYIASQIFLGRDSTVQIDRLQVSFVRGASSWWSSLPAAWPGQALAEVGLGHAGAGLAYLGASAVFSLLLVWLAISLSAHLLVTGWATYQEVGRRSVAPVVQGATAASFPRPGSVEAPSSRRPSWRPLLGKEWRGLRRDPQLWAQLFYPLLIVGFSLYRAFARIIAARGAGTDNASAAWFYGTLAFMTYLLVISLALAAINREGRSLQLLALLPLSARRILLAKWVFCMAPVLALIALFSGIGAVLLRQSLWAGILAVLTLAGLTAALTGCMLQLSLIWPRLDATNARRQVSMRAGLAGSILGLMLTSVSGGVLILALILSNDRPLAGLVVGGSTLTLNGALVVLVAASAPARLDRLMHGSRE